MSGVSQNFSFARVLNYQFVLAALFMLLLTLAFVSLEVPLIYLLIIPLSLLIAFESFKKSEVALYCFLGASLAVSLKPKGLDTSAIDILAGLIIIGISITTLISKSIFKREKLFSSSLQYLICAYYLYSVILGIIGVAFWGVSVEIWFRETLIQLPFLIIPVLMGSAFKDNDKAVSRFYILVLLAWVVTSVINIYVFRRNVANAYYLYQTGRSSMEISIPSLILLVLFSLSSVYLMARQRILLIAGILLCLVVIGISLFRTIWLTDIMLLPVIIFLMKKYERGEAIKFGIITLLIAAFFATIIVINIPFIGLLIKSFYLRFLYSSAVTTDPSLINRYIEWDNVLKTIKQSPIVGYGLGGTYYDYNWILGYSYEYGFTHNGYLYLLLKSGVIGAVLLGLGYIGFLVKGYKLLKNTLLLSLDRAIVRAGFVFLLGALFTNITLNALAQRDAVFWISVIWGYFLFIDQKAQHHS